MRSVSTPVTSVRIALVVLYHIVILIVYRKLSDLPCCCRWSRPHLQRYWHGHHMQHCDLGRRLRWVASLSSLLRARLTLQPSQPVSAFAPMVESVRLVSASVFPASQVCLQTWSEAADTPGANCDVVPTCSLTSQCNDGTCLSGDTCLCYSVGGGGDIVGSFSKVRYDMIWYDIYIS